MNRLGKLNGFYQDKMIDEERYPNTAEPQDPLEAARAMVYAEEGFRNEAYADPYSPQEVARRKKQEGWEQLSPEPVTIGAGRTTAAGLGEVKMGDTTTKEAEDELVTKKLQSVFQYMKNKGLPEDPAIASAIYNIGEGNFSEGSLPELGKQGKWKEFADKLEQYRLAGGQVSKGLIVRRRNEANEIRRRHGLEEKPELEYVVVGKKGAKKGIVREKGSKKKVYGG